jgi:hypothetical protein
VGSVASFMYGGGFAEASAAAVACGGASKLDNQISCEPRKRVEICILKCIISAGDPSCIAVGALQRGSAPLF